MGYRRVIIIKHNMELSERYKITEDGRLDVQLAVISNDYWDLPTEMKIDFLNNLQKWIDDQRMQQG